EAVRAPRELAGRERRGAGLERVRIDPALEGRARLIGDKGEGRGSIGGGRSLPRPRGDPGHRRVGLRGEALEGRQGGLRGSVVLQEPPAAAEAAPVSELRVGGWVAPQKPEEALQVPR